MPDLPRGPHFDAEAPVTVKDAAAVLIVLAIGAVAVWGLYTWLAGMLGLG